VADLANHRRRAERDAMTDQDRAAFEQWVSVPPYERPVHRQGQSRAWPGQYHDIETQIAWEAWQAARALPAPVERKDGGEMLLSPVDDAATALESLDIRLYQSAPVAAPEPWAWTQPASQQELLGRLANARDLRVPEREHENLHACAIKALADLPHKWMHAAARVQGLINTLDAERLDAEQAAQEVADEAERVRAREAGIGATGGIPKFMADWGASHE